ncbi:MAG TPA: tetratricopeptide repeat protein [Pirellulales bacterium]|jgi:tetratricopeptide (TPR) repeat protein|nr:tetratricopeptide repeat protein [Pirellulales bacterium]
MEPSSKVSAATGALPSPSDAAQDAAALRLAGQLSAGGAAAAPGERRRRWHFAAAALTIAASAAAIYGFVYTNSPEQCYRRALGAVARDDFDEAQYLLLRLQRAPDYEAQASVIAGILKLHENQWDDALHELHFAVDHPRTKGLALTLMGRTFLQKGLFHAAERTLRAALAHDDTLVEAHRDLGAAYFEAGNLVAAANEFRLAIKLAPDDPRPYRSLGIIRQEFHQYEEAIEDFREALRRDAGHAAHLSAAERWETLLDLAKIQEQDLGRHEDALATLEQANVEGANLEQAAVTADSLALRAACHYALGDVEAAGKCAEAALQIDADHVEALLIKVRLAMNANDAVVAEALLNHLLRVQPKHQIAHHMLSQVLQTLGRGDEAEQHAQEASQIRELKNELGKLTELAAREPPNAADCFRLGLMAERAGEEVMAVNWYRAALLLDPQQMGAKSRLSQLPSSASGT